MDRCIWFDTKHFEDYSIDIPFMLFYFLKGKDIKEYIQDNELSFQWVYKNFEYVENEVKNIIDQILHLYDKNKWEKKNYKKN